MGQRSVRDSQVDGEERTPPMARLEAMQECVAVLKKVATAGDGIGWAAAGEPAVCCNSRSLDWRVTAAQPL